MARETIRQKITLEGAEEIVTQLRTVGDAGRKAFDQIKGAIAKAGVDVGPLEKTFGRLRQKYEEVGATGRKLTLASRDLRLGLARVGDAAGVVATRIGLITAAATAASAATFGLTKSAADNIDALKDQADGLGLGIEAFSKFEFAASQSGEAGEVLVQALQRINLAIGEAASTAKAEGAKIGQAFARGARPAVEAFEEIGVTVTRGVEGMKAAAGSGAEVTDVLAALGVKVRDATGALRKQEDIIYDIADAFAAIDDPIKRATLGQQLFGKAWLKVAPFFTQGSKKLRELGDEGVRVGAVFTDLDAAISGEFNDSLEKMAKAATTLKDRIGLTFAPAFTEAFERITDVIARNQKRIVALASDLAATVGPVFEDLVRLITGDGPLGGAQGGEGRNQWLFDLRDGVLEFGKAVQTTMRDVVVPAFDLIRGAANVVAGVINTLTLGFTSLNGTQILVAAGALQMVGAFTALGAVSSLVVPLVQAVIALGTAIAAVIGWPALIVAGVVAAGAAIFIFWDDARDAAVDFYDGAVDLFSGFGSAIADAFNDAVAGIRDTFSSLINWASGQIARLRDLVTDLISKISDAFSSSSSSGGEGFSYSGNGGGGFATGGLVRGPGSGTSDSILARISNGEFVVRAAAVRRYGADFFASLNSLRVPGFAMGGLVETVAPSSGGRPLVLNVGNETINGLTASPQATEEILRFAKRRAAAQIGRKPGWAT